jgi:chromate reductase
VTAGNNGFTGGVRAQQQMNETLVSIPARLVLRPQIVIGGVHEKVRDGRLVSLAALPPRHFQRNSSWRS